LKLNSFKKKIIKLKAYLQKQVGFFSVNVLHKKISRRENKYTIFDTTDRKYYILDNYQILN